ncbi:MAG: hypothetical protein KAS48_05590, partial [Gammaproteobacteria bacterium]|nr:hypothetical protein [Gammaproteobacteria bacterium]
MNKTLISTAVTSVLGAAALTMSMGASAALTGTETLSLNTGVYGQTCGHDTALSGGACLNVMGTFESGSGFSMGGWVDTPMDYMSGAGSSAVPGTDGVIDPITVTGLTGQDGVMLGQTQAAGAASCTGFGCLNDGGAVTAGWGFFDNTGHDFTAAGGITANNDGTLDMSAWRVTWNGIGSINMGGDGANFTEDTGLGSIDCFSDAGLTSAVAGCTAGDYYRVDYAAHVPLEDPSNFGGVLYNLRLEG